ncbi:MAG: FAD-binding protein [Proteobacteria bacterium]|nr:FAD-binding protein [Pseudomonadota bacterium]
MEKALDRRGWDHETDLIAVGSGGGGMTAALTARLEGLEALVLEKTEFYGGSTAISVGGIWIPNNHLMAAAGMRDSTENARTYMRNTVGDCVSQANRDAFVVHAPEMVRYLSKLPHMKFEIMPGYCDYYPEKPGGTLGGRGITTRIFSGRKLGGLFNQLRRGSMKIPFDFVLTGIEGRKLALVRTNPLFAAVAFRVVARNLLNKAVGLRHVAMGESLIGRLRMSLHEQDVPVWLETPVRDIVVENGAAVGVVVEREGRTIRIRARRGIVLAAGGFPHHKGMRKKFQKHPVGTEWTVAAPGNTGEIIETMMKAGAAVDLMDDAWWGPSMLPPDEPPYFMVTERSYPGGIIVNSKGRRFTNESASFVDVVHKMYETDGQNSGSIPAFFIIDNRFRSKYILGSLMPGKLPPQYLDSGYIVKADTIEELAEKEGLDPSALSETIERFNSDARQGKDRDFQRGDSAYDRFYSDPSVSPNSCLAPLEKPPFYSVRIYPGDLGTKGGLLTNERAQVLREDGKTIGGLYAVGNTAASVMGRTYPGPGCTIAPAMTFGYIAAKHAAGAVLD